MACLLVWGTLTGAPTAPWAVHLAGLAGDHAAGAMGEGCAACTMPEDATIACGDLCAAPPLVFAPIAPLRAPVARLPQPSPKVVPTGRLGPPELQPPNGPLAIRPAI